MMKRGDLLAWLRRWRLVWLISVAASMCPAASAAGPEVLHALASSEVVAGPLVQGPDGQLYGTALGGQHRRGMVFRVEADGQLTALHDFDGSDGESPLGLVLAPDGYFYGVTGRGGEFDAGAAFRIDTDGRFKLLRSFRRSVAEGGLPRANLLLASDGHFYGTTLVGGAADRGTVFRMKRNGQIRWLHAFDPARQDGASPMGRLIEGSDGLFYGTTTGGGAHCCGTVFKMHRNGGLRVLHSFSFDGRDGYAPDTGVTEGPDGYFYGVARGHRENRRGLIYRLPRTGPLEVVQDFPPPSELNGREPRQALTLGRDGAFYGTTSLGGVGKLGGTIFRFTTDGQLTTLHSFVFDSPVGSHAGNTLLERADGEFIGATTAGGEARHGSIYRLRLTAP